MDPIVALSLADGLLSLLEKLAPHIQAGVTAGTISVETQTAIQARAEAALAPDAFIGPEWVPSTETPSGVTGFKTSPPAPSAPTA